MVNRRAFTLIEILVVISVIGVLAALTIPGLMRHLGNSKITATQSLVRTIAGAIVSYGNPLMHGEGVARMRWDANRDGAGDQILDGDPVRDEAFLDADRLWAQKVGYGGFAHDSAADIPPAFLDAQGRVVDSWKQPLRIRFDSRRYPNGFRLWSLGPDPNSAADDIGDPERP